MTRPGRTPTGPGPADLFADDPDEVVLGVLRAAGEPLTAIGIKKALAAGGVTRSAVERAWPALQPRLARHPGVVREGRWYRATAPGPATTPPPPAPPTTRRGRPKPPEPELPVREPAPPVREAERPDPTAGTDLEAAARQRQARLDGVRALAELAGEVEELAANGAGATAMIHRVRARVRRSGLVPIDRAGEETAYDRRRHAPISGSIADGTTVVVVRPGYRWQAPDEELLITKAIVEEE